VFVITWQVSSRVTDCGCLRHPLVYRPFSRHRFFLFPDSALSPCTNSNEHLNPLFTRLGLRSHDTSHIYLATIPTRIRVIRDDYNKLWQFLIYVFYRSLTKHFKPIERYLIREKVSLAIPPKKCQRFGVRLLCKSRSRAHSVCRIPDSSLESLILNLYSGSKVQSYIYGKSHLGTPLLLSLYFHLSILRRYPVTYVKVRVAV